MIALSSIFKNFTNKLEEKLKWRITLIIHLHIFEFIWRPHHNVNEEGSSLYWVVECVTILELIYEHEEEVP